MHRDHPPGPRTPPCRSCRARKPVVHGHDVQKAKGHSARMFPSSVVRPAHRSPRSRPPPRSQRRSANSDRNWSSDWVVAPGSAYAPIHRAAPRRPGPLPRAACFRLANPRGPICRERGERGSRARRVRVGKVGVTAVWKARVPGKGDFRRSAAVVQRAFWGSDQDMAIRDGNAGAERVREKRDRRLGKEVAAVGCEQRLLYRPARIPLAKHQHAPDIGDVVTGGLGALPVRRFPNPLGEN